jgi:hypothetical protein
MIEGSIVHNVLKVHSLQLLCMEKKLKDLFGGVPSATKTKRLEGWHVNR